jgi:hypothetical protein
VNFFKNWRIRDYLGLSNPFIYDAFQYRLWMEIKVFGSLVIVLTFLLTSSISNGYHPYVSGQGNDDNEPVHIAQSNESWPIMIVYGKKDVYFQDEFLECLLNRSIPGELVSIINQMDLQLLIDNGNLTEYEEPRNVYYYNRNMPSWIRRDYGVFQSRYYVLKPQELDRNFEMTLTFTIWDQNMEIYREDHVFRIIGEPELIPGIDPNKDSNVHIIYSLSFLVSVIAILVGHRVFIIPRRKRDE